MKLLRAKGNAAWAGPSPFGVLLEALVAISLLVGPLCAQQPSPLASAELPGTAGRQIEALLEAKARRTPAQRKVSSQLLNARRSVRGQAAAKGITRRQAQLVSVADEIVTVDIHADVTQEVLKRIRTLDD